MSCILIAQVLLTFHLPDVAPARFGVPLPATVLAKGLRLQDGTGSERLQWRRLQPAADPTSGRCWVEILVSGMRGDCRLAAGSGPGGGTVAAACAIESESIEEDDARRQRRVWRWSSGEVDDLVRTTFLAPVDVDGESYAGGESLTRWSPQWLERTLRARLPRSLWTVAGVLPAGGEQSRELRARLVEAAHRLRELPGARGAGDFERMGGEITNLEYDTTLGLLRLGLHEGDRALLALGYRCARHTIDRDLDPATGLPFPHGATHRSGRPAPGHAWLQGLLLAGCLFADDDLLAGARTIALSLAANPPAGEGEQERARDYGWPLLELEGYLAFARDPTCVRAADSLAIAIGRRFDPKARTFLFGEGKVGEDVYFERAWITGGILLPALRAHLRRRPASVLADMVAAAEDALLDRLGNGKPGIPTHWRVAGGAVFAEHRAHDDPLAALLFEGFAPKTLERLLRKGGLWRALGEVPALGDPDLPTSFSILARCSWVYR